MTPEWLQPLLDWLTLHPTWAGVIIFAVAMLESLLVVGVIVPGALVMLGSGTLIALGALDLWGTLLWAIAGAIVGDSISYWIGWYFKDTLRNYWPFTRHPEMLQRGEQFFSRHGGKSVAFGRFVGPIRAVIPTIAGIMGMTPRRFLVINVLSAIVWAPVYILPGVAVGASLTLASQVATRLGLLLLFLLVVIWLLVWSMRATYLFFQPRASRLILRALSWSQAHPSLGRWTTPLFDPTRPEATSLSAFALVLLLASWVFAAVLIKTASGVRLIGADEFTFHFLQSVRTPIGDHIMVAISQLGDAVVAWPLGAALLLWFLWQRHWLASAHWIAALAFAVAITFTLKALLEVPRPLEAYTGAATFAFPSGHTVLSTVIFGLLAVILARELPPIHRWIAYAAAVVIIFAIGFSRIYLGAHWLSDVVGGFTFGIAWVALLGIGYHHHCRQAIPAAKTILLTLGLLLGLGGWHISQHHEKELARYEPKTEQQSLPTGKWWGDAWRSLPAFRLDVRGQNQHPMNIQWAGSLTEIRQQLLALGWNAPPPLSFAGAMHWLTPEPVLAQLPALPHVHNGQHEALRLVHSAASDSHQLVIRLWDSRVRFTDLDAPLWIGSVTHRKLKSLPFFSYGVTSTNFGEPLSEAKANFEHLPNKRVTRLGERPPAALEHITWNGDVLLVRTLSSANETSQQ